MSRPLRVLAPVLIIASLGLSGCLAAAATGVVVGTAGAAVGVTGKVVGTGVDLVTTSDKEREKKERKRRKKEEREERRRAERDR